MSGNGSEWLLCFLFIGYWIYQIGLYIFYVLNTIGKSKQFGISTYKIFLRQYREHFLKCSDTGDRICLRGLNANNFKVIITCGRDSIRSGYCVSRSLLQFGGIGMILSPLGWVKLRFFLWNMRREVKRKRRKEKWYNWNKTKGEDDV